MENRDNYFSPWAARTFGFILLWAFVAYGGGDSWMVSLRAKHLSSLSFSGPVAHELGVVLLGALLFPLLWHHGAPGVAAGYLATRVAEALLLAAGVVAQLLLVPLSAARLTGDGGSAEGSAAPRTGGGRGGGGVSRADLADLLVSANFYCFQIAMLALGLGSLPVCLLLLRRRLLPAWMAAWGLLGYSLLATGCVAELHGAREGTGVALAIPGGLWEMALGLWLLARGGFLPGNSGGASSAKKQS
ncbi:hypothetical protein HYH02_013716 [Chlamydomonas schloesseri]|uniref:DUF4386 domain-containing protein n=1 Tax=Chlamydomonas schloesseri TaxID=2026947 RepID=A0A835SV30_9CHLO|nr:hypothetical protein HYH02_013716 [Chlamydomonas schloesseri]|eukprot:KAG2430353.1 hypothetical protein HYH02_013716 [Chlamydomonas schloesseri]